MKISPAIAQRRRAINLLACGTYWSSAFLVFCLLSACASAPKDQVTLLEVVKLVSFKPKSNDYDLFSLLNPDTLARIHSATTVGLDVALLTVDTRMMHAHSIRMKLIAKVGAEDYFGHGEINLLGDACNWYGTQLHLEQQKGALNVYVILLPPGRGVVRLTSDKDYSGSTVIQGGTGNRYIEFGNLNSISNFGYVSYKGLAGFSETEYSIPTASPMTVRLSGQLIHAPGNLGENDKMGESCSNTI